MLKENRMWKKNKKAKIIGSLPLIDDKIISQPFLRVRTEVSEIIQWMISAIQEVSTIGSAVSLVPECSKSNCFKHFSHGGKSKDDLKKTRKNNLFFLRWYLSKDKFKLPINWCEVTL